MNSDLGLRLIAIVLMLAGAAMLVAGLSAGIAFPAIAIGVALVIVLQRRTRAGS